MKPSIGARVNVSNRLSTTLKNWLPLLQAPINELEQLVNKSKEENPFIEVETGFEERDAKIKKSIYEPHYQKYSSQETIEKLTIAQDNLIQKLYTQIDQNLFPTPISKNIAHEIVYYLDDKGYFEGDKDFIAQKLGVPPNMVENVRQRFAQLDPPGIGAIDYKESFLFQLEHTDLDDDPALYDFCRSIISDLENVHKFKKHKLYKKAMDIVKHFKNPPKIEYYEDTSPIIPDVLIFLDNDNQIEVSLNNSYYPSIKLDIQGYDRKNAFVKDKIKKANDLIHALDMRKSTLLKVSNLIVEHQYDFFCGGAIKPMKLKDIAKELGYNQSTISRAISDKYISCNRGMYIIKSFFTTALGDEAELSNSSIKNFIQELIKSENPDKPYSDERLRKKIKEAYNIDIVRRTVTKYRKQLSIGSSSERKKYLYH